MNLIKNKVTKIPISFICKKINKIPRLQKEFSHLPFSGLAFQKLMKDFGFNTVLDIGSGAGIHTELFLKYNKQVTSIDLGSSVYYKNKSPDHTSIIANFNEYKFNKVYECVWCSHVLEHQTNVNLFLRKVFNLLKENGVLAITVSPLKHQIVGGHVSLWNAGLLLYNLILSGFNCRNASVLKYDYNISIIVKKQSAILPTDLSYDRGDIRKLKSFFPNGIRFYSDGIDNWFDGNITRLNW